MNLYECLKNKKNPLTYQKIKFYMFASEDVTQPGDLGPAKEAAAKTLAVIKEAVDADARKRSGE